MDSSRWGYDHPRPADPSDHRRHHGSHRKTMKSSYRRRHKQSRCHKGEGGEIPKSLNSCVIAQQQKCWELGFHRSSKKASFPEEIIGEILVRLPSVKSVIKCSAVCKSWRCLIKSSTFVHAHLSRNQNKNNDDDMGSLLLLRQHFSGVFLLYCDKPAASAFGFRFGGENTIFNNINTQFISPFIYESPYIRVDIFDIVTSSCSCFNLVGTCNGLICLANDYSHLPLPTIIWNPSVRKFVTLPSPSIIGDAVIGNDRLIRSSAFGYDSQTDDYKVLRILSNVSAGGYAGDTPFGVEVYSLARGCWRTLSPAAAAFPGCFHIAQEAPIPPRHVFVNDALHWLLPRHRNFEECLIVSFDMVTESFGEIKMPEALRKPPFGFPTLSIYEESLALIDVEVVVDPILATRSYDLHLWIMKQYGVVESWTKLYSVTLHDQEDCPILFSFKNSGEQVFKMLTNSGEHLLMVDFKTKQVKYSGVNDGSDYRSMNSFVESLVLLDHPNATSYEVAAIMKQQRGFCIFEF